MPKIRLIHFTAEDVMVNDSRPEYQFFKLGKRQVEITEGTLRYGHRDIEKKTFQGVKIANETGEHCYFYDIEEVKDAMPLVDAIIWDRCNKLHARAVSAEDALRTVGKELYWARQELNYLNARWYNRLARFLRGKLTGKQLQDLGTPNEREKHETDRIDSARGKNPRIH